MYTPPPVCSLSDTYLLSPACTVPGLETRGDKDPALPSWSSQSGERDMTAEVSVGEDGGSEKAVVPV